ncbi:hypothetical protein BCR43DRAFT_499830 [Syncephalastrum racemosum]|uniref:BHLH domain-containing protein n=1 Tax=Syncephalastrum racemosum TaxID=13706 RepID=A0A1X2GZP6_SYNRA|nr:hypothetical protein BCR43DRAFT_499830 [Syncephalastrum racemosum]
MSEIVLSTSSTNQYVPDYSSANMMAGFDTSVVKSSPTSSHQQETYEENSSQYNAAAYQDYTFQQMPLNYPVTYPVGRFNGYYGDQPMQQQQQQHAHQQQQQQPSANGHPGSPDSISSSTSPQTPPPASSSNATSTPAAVAAAAAAAAAAAVQQQGQFSSQVLTTQALDTPSVSQSSSTATNSMITPLVPSSTFTNATTERVKETIARANSVPMEFYHTEFLEYSKETYEKKMDAKRNKRKRPQNSQQHQQQQHAQLQHGDATEDAAMKKKRGSDIEKDDSDDEPDDEAIAKEAEERGLTNAELRRQIHIQSEQKRRAQIKDGFDELRKHLPGCNNKKMSKAALLTRTVQQIQHLKGMQTELLSEVERLVQENETLKKFQHGVLQRQAMEKMYTF